MRGEEKAKVGAKVRTQLWETWLRMRKLNGGGLPEKDGMVMKGSSCEVRDDGGSFRMKKYESREGVEREAPHGMVEEGPL